MYRLLDLPKEYCFPLIALVLGYPKAEPAHREKGRLCGPGVIHFGTYHRLTPDEIATIVREYDDPQKRFLTLIDQWREKGYAHYLEYFFSKWFRYPKKEDPAAFAEQEEAPDAQIVNLLRTTSFLVEDAAW